MEDKVLTINDNPNYCFHIQMKGEDGKLYSLSYDLTSQTQKSIAEFTYAFQEVEKRFPGIQFKISSPKENLDDWFWKLDKNITE